MYFTGFSRLVKIMKEISQFTHLRSPDMAITSQSAVFELVGASLAKDSLGLT